jgi:hypothetical protein
MTIKIISLALNLPWQALATQQKQQQLSSLHNSLLDAQINHFSKVTEMMSASTISSHEGSTEKIYACEGSSTNVVHTITEKIM